MRINFLGGIEWSNQGIPRDSGRVLLEHVENGGMDGTGTGEK